MSGRNRARGNANQDNDDQERRLWEAIQERSKEVDTKEVSFVPPSQHLVKTSLQILPLWGSNHDCY